MGALRAIPVMLTKMVLLLLAFGCSTVDWSQGMTPSPEDYESLLAELGTTVDGSVTFNEFAGVMARLIM